MQPRNSMFREAPRAFMDEGTPLEFSRGTSLSSLTFDDEDIPPRSCGDGKDSSTTSSTSQEQLETCIHRPSRDLNRSSIPRPQSAKSSSSGRESRVSRTSSEGPPNKNGSRLSLRTPSEGPPQRPPKMSVKETRESAPDGEANAEADERRLAALIKSGMPSSKKPLRSPLGPPVAPPRAVSRQGIPPPPPPPPIASVLGQSSAIPIKTPNLQVTVEAINLSSTTESKHSGGNWGGNDSLHKYCTEGTPVNHSATGSISDLSQLSIPGERSPRALTTDSNDSEDSNDGGKKLLEKCIRSGKPTTSQRPKEIASKDRQLLSPRRPPHNRSIPVARVIPAIKVGVVSPRTNFTKSPNYANEELKTWAVEDTTSTEFPPVLSADFTMNPTSSSTPKNYKGLNTSLQQPRKIKEPTGLISPSNSNDEMPKRFAVEDTPSCMSRHSSRNSVESEEIKSYAVENTPIHISHSSSLSSLSVESEETTPREEALLRHCIDQGMPKATTRIPPIGGASRRMVPGVPMQHLHLSNYENRLTNSINPEAESKKLHSENEQSEKRSPVEVIERRASETSPEEVKVSQKGLETSSGSGGHSKEASYSESNVLEEALQLAKDVSDEPSCEMSLSSSSACIDQINPPSAMGSVLSLSACSGEEQKTYFKQTFKQLECRHTKVIPQMVRRAIGDVVDGGGSMASSCHSNLDNICAPSLVDDDMESSMMSVASIMSEVVEHQDSPPSLSLNSDAISGIVGPAHQIAKYLQREAEFGTTMTLTGGEETSTCQEITDFEETLAAQQQDGTASDTEIAVDDLPNDIPDLPQDSPVRTSAKNSPRLIPKSQHPQWQDRFKTFTRKSSSPDSSKGTPESSPVAARTSRQRRSDNSDRFKTRTISYESPVNLEQQQPVIVGDQITGKIIPIENQNNSIGSSEARRSFKQRRQQNPSRYQTRTIEVPVTQFTANSNDNDGLVDFQDGDDLDLTQEQMEVLNQDANIVICSLNENREGMTMNEADIFSEENILDIETLSLISNDDETEMLDFLMEDTTYTIEDVIRKPRIVKPGEESIGQEEIPTEKIIRGKRKPLYSSGRQQSNSKINSSPSPRNQPSKQNISPKQPRATRSSALRHLNKGTVSGDDSSKPSSSPSSSAGSSPRLGASSSSRAVTSNLKRQNTFTKDDVTAPEKPARKNPMPAKGIVRSRIRKDVVQPSPQYQPPSAASLATSRLNFTKSNSQEWNMPQQNAEKNTSDKPFEGESKTNKKDVTSRIANLWKRVEKAQNVKSPKAKDDKVWIAGNSKTSKGSSSQNKLVRSSTFEKDNNGRSSLGLKFSRLKGRDSKSSPPSEASTPVNSRPECLVSPTVKPRPATHPSATMRSGHPETSDENKEKRLSRLGSFIIVDEEEISKGKVSSPFSYKPDSEHSSRSSSITRIPQPPKPWDDNGNSAVLR